MPVPMPRSHMLPLDTIVRTAVREHPHPHPHPHPHSAPNTDVPRVIERTRDALARGIVEVPPYDAQTSPQLQVCRFRCMMQDTGYPLEVYMPPPAEGEGEDEDGDEDAMDWTRLKERWVGWGVEVPGEQPWIKECLDGVAARDVVDQLQTMRIGETGGTTLPDVVRGKWPLPGAGAGGEYQGALIKIYDPNVSFRPGTAYECVGLLSQSHLPASSQDFDTDPAAAAAAHESALVPCLHLLADPRPIYPLDPSLLLDPDTDNASRSATRDETIAYLASLLPRADRTAAEVLLLALIARVTAKAPGAVPLGTLALNLLLPRGRSQDATDGERSSYPVFARLVQGIRAVAPLVVDIPLSIRLLSTHPFFPRSSHVVGGGGGGGSGLAGDSLQSGLLQLAPSTVVLVNEDTLEGGALQDAAVRNLRALAETVRTQKLRYEFPYVGEDFGMETDLGFVVVGQGKSLLPVDLHMPLLGSEPDPLDSNSDADPESRAGTLAIARYLAETRARSGDLVIPPDVVEFIQAEFIRLRREGLGVGVGGQKIEVGEADLRNWMRMGRLLAVSYPGATFTKDVWTRVLEIDLERRIRMDAR